MGSLVQELQLQAASHQPDLSELLRKALIVAVKLNLSDLKTWIERELKGYPWPTEDFPQYRIVPCRIMANHPYYGRQLVEFDSPDLHEQLSTVPLTVPVGQITALLQANKSAINPFPPDQEKILMGAMNVPVAPHRVVDHSELARVMDDIRLTSLNWFLKLEMDGVLGDGINFSEEEKRIAAQNIYHIQNFVGIAGSPQAESINIDNHAVLIGHLECAGLEQSELAEIKSILSEFKRTTPVDRPSLAKRGMEWIGRNWDKVGTLAVEITKQLT